MSEPAEPSPRRRAGPLRKLLLVVAASLVAFCLAEGGASVAESARHAGLLNDLSEQRHSRYDPELGWAHEPGSAHPDLYGPGRSLTINDQGLRAEVEYDVEVAAGQRRVLCLGDSFTLGYGVGDDDTFAARLDALCDGLQTVNMGQGGYGLDQAYLWYAREGDRLDADVVLLSFIDADFYRMQKEVFSGYPKPRLRVEDGELVVGNVPVPRTFGEFAAQRQWSAFVDGLALTRLARPADAPPTIQRAPPEPDMSEVESLILFELAETILAEVQALCEARGSQLVLAYIPTKKLLFRRNRTRIHRWAGRFAAERELPFIDLTPVFEAFEPTEVQELFLPDNHFDVRGNALLAQGLLDGLREVWPDVVPCEPADVAAPQDAEPDDDR